MRGLETRLTQKGQVTIPASVRAKLGLKPRDRVRFEVEGNAVRIKPATSKLLAGFGAVKAKKQPVDWRKLRSHVEHAVATEVIEEDQ